MSSDFFPCSICSRLADPAGDHALACGRVISFPVLFVLA